MVTPMCWWLYGFGHVDGQTCSAEQMAAVEEWIGFVSLPSVFSAASRILGLRGYCCCGGGFVNDGFRNDGKEVAAGLKSTSVVLASVIVILRLFSFPIS